MAIPAGITTALVHMDAPVSFTGDPGRVHVTIASSVPLVWAATGTPFANFVDVVTPGDGQEMQVELPHTDQSGFLDSAGNSYKDWNYVVKIKYEKDGQIVHFADRAFQILQGQTSVDLALIPAGVASAPTVAPIQTVTSLNGRNGAVVLVKADVGLDRVNNTNDLEKPISTTAQAALDVKFPKFAAAMASAQDLNTYTTSGIWNLMSNAVASGGTNYPVPFSGLLEVFGRSDGTAALQRYTRHGANEVWVREFYAAVWTPWSRIVLSTDPTATGAAQGLMSAADKTKLDAATAAEVNNALVVRDLNGNAAFGSITASDAPTAVSHVTRKDYVDNKVAAVTYATLGVVPTASLPPLAISEPFVVADQAAMLALVAQRGDVAIRTDIGRSYILASDSPGTLADWKLLTAAGDVISVAGRTGTVVLVKADVGLSNVDNTSDANKPVSTAQQTALNAKAPLASPAFTGTPTGITKTHVGLANVDNVSDANKPVSTAQQTALDKLAKGRLAKYTQATNTANIGATTTVIYNVPSFAFKAGRKYRIEWDTDWIGNTVPCAADFSIATCSTADAAGVTTGLTVVGLRTGQASVAGVSSNIKVTAYYEPVADVTVQLKFLTLMTNGSTVLVQGNRAQPQQYIITDDGMQY